MRRKNLLTQVLVANLLLAVAAVVAASVAGNPSLDVGSRPELALVLGFAVALTILVNVFMLQRRFRPLERLVDEMERADLSRRAVEAGVLAAGLGALPRGAAAMEERLASEAQLVFAQLEVAASRFLNRRLTYFGFIAQDPSVRDAVLAQRPIVDHLPQSAASRCFRILASRLAGLVPHHGSGLRLVAPLECASPSSPEAPECA